MLRKRGFNMDTQTIMTAISTVGFPIVMSLILIYLVYKQGEDHKEEMNQMRESINNNTLALQHLTDLISKEETK